MNRKNKLGYNCWDLVTCTVAFWNKTNCVEIEMEKMLQKKGRKKERKKSIELKLFCTVNNRKKSTYM